MGLRRSLTKRHGLAAHTTALTVTKHVDKIQVFDEGEFEGMKESCIDTDSESFGHAVLDPGGE
jgi:hypothetical protein